MYERLKRSKKAKIRIWLLGKANTNVSRPTLTETPLHIHHIPRSQATPTKVQQFNRTHAYIAR